jgi:hypothetical protein
MEARNFAIPLLAFAGGAILGRLLGLKTLARGAMTAAALTGMVSQPALVGTGATTPRVAARQRTTTRSARKRPAQKKSHPVGR